MGPLIKIKNLSVHFGSFVALNSLSLDLHAGKITGLIGPSGAGKTTLMRSIVGRQKLTSGSVHVLGYAAGSKELRDKINYKTQEISAYDDLTVHENLTYFAKMLGVKKQPREKQVNSIIKQLDLEPQQNQISHTLSGGQRQRLSLAIALLGTPKLLVLDEPTVGLDPVLRDELWALFKSIAESGTSIIISSHAMDEAERCDELMLIRDGEILMHDTPAAIKTKTKTKTIEESFLKLVRAGGKNG